MSCSGGDWLDGVREVGGMLLLHCSGGPLLGYFLVRAKLFIRGSLLGLVDGVKESLLEVVTWSEVACTGQLEGPKLVTFLLCYSNEIFLKLFR